MIRKYTLLIIALSSSVHMFGMRHGIKRRLVAELFSFNKSYSTKCYSSPELIEAVRAELKDFIHPIHDVEVRNGDDVQDIIRHGIRAIQDADHTHLMCILDFGRKVTKDQDGSLTYIDVKGEKITCKKNADGSFDGNVEPSEEGLYKAFRAITLTRWVKLILAAYEHQQTAKEIVDLTTYYGRLVKEDIIEPGRSKVTKHTYIDGQLWNIEFKTYYGNYPYSITCKIDGIKEHADKINLINNKLDKKHPYRAAALLQAITEKCGKEFEPKDDSKKSLFRKWDWKRD